MNIRVVGADAVVTTANVADELMACVGTALLFTVSAFNNTAGDLYLQVYDVASKGDAVDPRLVTTVYAGMSGGFGFGDGALFVNGIYVCWSSDATGSALPGSGTAGIIDVTYRKR